MLYHAINMSAERNRQGLMYVQRQLGIPADGQWGPQTKEAFDRLVGAGKEPSNSEHMQPPATHEVAKKQPTKTVGQIPQDDYESIVEVYGFPGTNLAMFQCPYPLRLAWEPSTVITKFTCHKLCIPDLTSIFQDIINLYGSLGRVKAARMDLFGGCYAMRDMRGSNNISRHSWGIAVDLDPDQNGLFAKKPPATMPDDVIDIFQKHGWKSGGRAWGRDYMHFQRTL